MALNHTVHILPHARFISVPDDLPVLAAAQLAGLPLPNSCRSGRCGSCRARLLSGRIEYAAGPPPGLSAQETQQGYVLLCQALARTDLVVEARLVPSAATAQIKTLPCRITRRRPLAADVMQLLLRVPTAEPLEFLAGQYLDVLFGGGRRRSYSVANAPLAGSEFEVHVRHVPGGLFSEPLFNSMREDVSLKIEGPLGSCVYQSGIEPVIFIAGGIGFAPIKAMLGQALTEGAPRELHFYWGSRDTAGLYEEALVRDWARRDARLTIHTVLSGMPASGTHRNGWVHEAVIADHPSLAPFAIYAAGPPAMIDAIRRTFPARDVRPGKLYLDPFVYASGVTSSPQAVEP